MAVNQALACFLETCDQNFTPMAHQYDLFTLIGLAEYMRGRHIITPISDVHSVAYPFHATARYEAEDFCVEFNYGDYNFTLECYVTFKNRYRFLLDDIIPFMPKNAKGAPIRLPDIQHSDAAPQAHHVQSLMRTYSQVLDVYLPDLMTLSDCVLGQALDAQYKRLQKRVREDFTRNKERACAKAKVAFQDCDYKKTIMLYRPYKDELEPHEYRIFSLAILYLDQ